MKFVIIVSLEIICWFHVWRAVGSLLNDRYDLVISVNGTNVTDLSATFNLTNKRKCGSLCLENSYHGFAIHKISKNYYLCHLGICPASLPYNVEWDVFKPASHKFEIANGELVLLTTDNTVNFERPWADYKAGFGDPATNYWIGLDTLHNLTTNNDYGMYITITDWENTSYWAYYCSFSVGPESDNYRLSVSGYDTRSTAGDSLTSNLNPNWNHNGHQFSTMYKDNDNHATVDCAYHRKTGWWYTRCGGSKLTGISQFAENVEGIIWKTVPGYNDLYGFRMSAMKLIPN